MKLISNFIASFIRKQMNSINLTKTFWVNMSLFPMRLALKFPILIYGKCRVDSLSGSVVFTNPAKRGMLKIGQASPIRSFDSISCLSIKGRLVVEKNVVLRRGIRISVNHGASLFLGRDVLISDNCSIICLKSISVGEGTYIGNNVNIMDSDFHYVLDTTRGVVQQATKRIIIGANNWIAAWNIVKKGAVTPNRTIVAGPYSMIGKDYTKILKEKSIIGGSPAKLIKEGSVFVNNVETEQTLLNYFENNECDYMVENDSFLWDFAK